MSFYPPLNPKDPTTGEPLLRPPYHDVLYQVPVALLKGALISYDPESQQTGDRIKFQYNPEKLTRSLTPQYEQEAKKKGQVGVKPPKETIDLAIKLQAVDSMIAQSSWFQWQAASRGLLAKLAALELLVYPTSDAITKYRDKLDKATKGAAPASAKPLLFQWGPHRLLPVRLTSISITETLFNIALAPIAGEVSLKLEIDEILEVTGLPYHLLLQNLEDMEDNADYESVTIDS